MKFRGPLIGLSVFMVIAVAMTWLVYSTLRRDVAGSTYDYAAMFTDVTGLRDGDDVRVAGVRVGRIESVAIDGDLAKVEFRVQTEQPLYGNTIATITYQNIVGQRYLGLSLGKTGGTDRLKPGSVIPVEQTEPSFDIGMLLHGFEPLFSVLDPAEVDNLTDGVVKSLQGDSGSIVGLVDQTSQLTETFAGRDKVLDDVITNLNGLTKTLAGQNKNLDSVLTHTREMVAILDNRRAGLVDSIGSTGFAVRRLSKISDSVYPQLNEILYREPGFVGHLNSVEPQLAFTGANLPLLLKGVARTTQEGAFINGYVCDLNITGFFPGLNDIVPIIVNAATPGNKAQYTPKCRNLADG
ncbi:MCE family protein [Mycobacteroides salmoniphilum]|uniref:MCE family protein n=1 Tax=Mycobacteroides salmoniphilum TaxID=404941 RepID=UPI000992E28B|nr:MCE family protein [Mycobacteroides salmoniphilum]QCH26121.1 mce related protein [Mycobacteroides salmoniphilum]